MEKSDPKGGEGHTPQLSKKTYMFKPASIPYPDSYSEVEIAKLRQVYRPVTRILGAECATES